MKSFLQSWPRRGLILVIFCFSFALQAQDERHYSGPFQVGSYVGEVDYSYHISSTDTLLHGPFNFRRSNLGALLDQKDKTFSFTGDFLNGSPNGAWQFLFGEFESDKKTEVVGYQYRVNINGIQQEAKGNIIEGKPDGIWTLEEARIVDSQVAETLFQSTINYDKGVPQRSFQIESGKQVLVGRFLRNGLAHDDWTLFGEGLLETWTFNEGVLIQIQLEQGEESRSIPIYRTPKDAMRTIVLDTRFSQLLRLQLSSNEAGNFQQGINRLLYENATHYKKLDDILSQLGPSEFMPKFQVKVPYAPLDSVEHGQLAKIKDNFNAAFPLAQGLLENTQLNLLKRSDPEAQFLYEVVVQLNMLFMEPLQQLMSYQKLEMLDYAPRKLLQYHLFPTGIPTRKIEIRPNAEEARFFELDSSEDYEFEGPVFEGLSQMAQYAHESLKQISVQLYQKVENEQEQREFASLEAQIILQINRLNQIIDSTESSGTALLALQRMKAQAESNLNSYSVLTKADGKLEKAQTLAACLAVFEQLAKNVDTLPQKAIEIEEIYKDAVWNPFMANLMEEEVKKRITFAYRNILIPYIVNQVGKDMDCEKASALNHLLEGLHTRMLQLRDEDTSKLERKLRKEKDPETILTLFNLQSLGE